MQRHDGDGILAGTAIRLGGAICASQLPEASASVDRSAPPTMFDGATGGKTMSDRGSGIYISGGVLALIIIVLLLVLIF